MNECRRVRRLLALRAADRSPAEQALVTAHVQACADCAAWARQCREQDVLIRSLPPVRPSPLRSQQFLAQIHTERRRLTMFTQLRTLGNVVATVAFLVGLALAVNFLVPRALPVQEHPPVASSEVLEATGVTLAPTIIHTPALPIQTVEPASGGCASSWFFTFDEDQRDLGTFCPGPVRMADAVGQDFEGGRVYRYAPDPAYTIDQRGTIYVIYNDGEWVTFPDTWDATQPSSDPNLVPPEGRYQPVESIGKVWRDNADVRNRLGWAYEVQRSFSGRIQHYSEESTPAGDNHFSFIDHGKWGVVLLLNSVDMGLNTWQVVGSYPSTEDVPALTVEALRNAEYQAGAYADFYDTVQLTDGAGDLPAWPNDPTMVPHVQLMESPLAFGDLNGDALADAVTLLDFHAPGTTGHLRVLAVVVNREGAPHNVATQSIGDRSIVEAITIQSGEVTIEAIVAGPDDPLMAPSQHVTWKFRLEGDAITWLSDTPEATPTPPMEAVTLPEPFALTEAWLAEMGAAGGFPDAAQLQQLAEALQADTMAYLDAAIALDVPLAEHQPALARMAADLPGGEGGRVLPVDLAPDVEIEMVVSAVVGGAPSLYAYRAADRWQIVPVPWPDGVVDPNLWPGAVESQDLTGDGMLELVVTYALSGGSGYQDYVQVFRRTGEGFVLLFRADLLNWAGESHYTLEPDPTQAGAMQIVLTYPHLYSLGFDHKMLNHPQGRQVWRWDAGVGRFTLAETEVDFERSAWGADMEITIEDRLRWLVNEGETRFRQGDYDAALPWYAQAVTGAKVEAWQPAEQASNWPAFASFRHAQLLLMMGRIDEGRAAMQPIANAWPGDPLSALAQAFLDGYGEGGEGAAERAIEAMRVAVDLEDHFYNEKPGVLRFPMDAEGILFSGVAAVPQTPEWPRVGAFD